MSAPDESLSGRLEAIVREAETVARQAAADMRDAEARGADAVKVLLNAGKAIPPELRGLIGKQPGAVVGASLGPPVDEVWEPIGSGAPSGRTALNSLRRTVTVCRGSTAPNELEDAILAYVAEHPGATSRDLQRATGSPQNTVDLHTRMLLRLRRLVDKRERREVSPGRRALVRTLYPLPAGSAPASPAAASEAAPAPTRAPSGQALVSAVRDYMVDVAGPRSAGVVAQHTRAPVQAVEVALDLLATQARPVVRRLPGKDGGPPLWEHVTAPAPERRTVPERPENGSAREGDMAARRGAQVASARPPRATVPAVQELLSAVVAAGGRYERAGNGHWNVRDAEGHFLKQLPATPSGNVAKTMHVFRSELRKAGLNV